MYRLPAIARRRRAPADWWVPGLPTQAPERPDDVTVADVVLAAEPLPCWHTRDPDDLLPEDGAMRWCSGLPLVRF